MKRIIGTSAFKNGFLKRDRFLISLILIFGMGVLAGSVAVVRASAYLDEIWQGYIIRQKGQGIIALFLDEYFSLMIVVAVNYILGHCAIGKPFLYAVVLIYGIGKGIVFSSIFVNSSLLKFIEISFSLGIQISFMILVVLFSAKTSSDHSKQIYDYGYRGKENSLNIRLYNRKYLLYCFLAALLCFLNAIILSRVFF